MNRWIVVACWAVSFAPEALFCQNSQLTVSPAALYVHAGTGRLEDSGDGDLATSASFVYPVAVALDPRTGAVYVADRDANRVRRIDTNGNISAFAGTGQLGYDGDGGPALAATLSGPSGLTVAPNGDLYIADAGNNVVRRVDAKTSVIMTVAGSGTQAGNDGLGDGGPATQATLWDPVAITFDSNGNLFIADSFDNLIRRVDHTNGIITAVVGTGAIGFSGDGGLAKSAELALPSGIAIHNNTLYIADTGNNVIRSVDLTSGIISTIAGSGQGQGSDGIGDQGPATDSQLFEPTALAVDAQNILYVADTFDGLVRRIYPGGRIEVVAGVYNSANFTVVPKASSSDISLSTPYGLGLSSDGTSLFIADTGNAVVRELRMTEGWMDFNQASNENAVLYNPGSAAVNISAVMITGANEASFSTTTTCSEVEPGSSCAIPVAYDGSESSSDGTELEVLGLAGGPLLSIRLSGNGVQSNSGGEASISLSTSSIDFGSVPVNTTSAQQKVTLTNTGSALLNIQSITASAGYSITQGCGTSLAVAAQCQLGIVFTPTATGSQTGQIAITSSAGAAQISLAGSGVGSPKLSVSATSIDFGSVPVNTTSTQHIATLTNTGDAALNIQSITASPDYSITRGCGTSLAVAARCQLGIVFTPTTTGSQTGQIAIASSVGAAQISLSGSGITTPKLSVSATSIDFGSVPVGNSTQQIALQITNAGPLSISGLSFVINGSFSFVNSCGAILAPLAGCAIQLTMTPTAIGMNTGYLNISSESAPAQQITLSGTGRNRQTEYGLLPTIRAQSLPASTAPVSLSPTVVGHNGTDATQQIAIPGNTAPVTLPASSFPNFQEAPTSTEITTAPIPANPTFQDAIAPSGLSSPDLPPTGSFIQLHSSIPVVCASCPNTLAVDGALGLRPPAVPARTKPVFSIWAESEPPKHKSTYRHVRGSACLLGERFQTVRVYIDHREIGLKTSEATPNLCSISLSKLCEHINWSSEMPLPLTSGRHTVEVTVRDAAGGDESATSTLIVNPNE